jgi:CRISPR-associated protein Csy1
MTNAKTLGPARIRVVINDFLGERLAQKIEKLKEDDPKRADLVTKFQFSTWLEDAAKRVEQIQVVTHTLKAVHPDAKGSSCHVPPDGMKSLMVVGSHCLGTQYELDVVGNAAALDVYKFLRLEIDGRSLLQLACEADSDFAEALSSNAKQAQAWMQAFSSLLQSSGELKSHTLAKQLFWPVHFDSANDDTNFHLLEPLYASSLAQELHVRTQEHRFGEASKAAREAKKTGSHSDLPVQNYPDLAIQQFGGTKPQNISQLNSQRRGNNLLFASLPPQWVAVTNKPLLNTDSMFWRYKQRREVRGNVQKLVKFLQSDPPSNLETRQIRERYVNNLLEEFLFFTMELRELPQGWTALAACKLKSQHAYWLDPQGALQADEVSGNEPPTNVLDQVADDFGLCLNSSLMHGNSGGLPVGDPEHKAWRTRATEVFKAFERGGLQEAGLLLDEQAEVEEESNHV